jgi:hypothetical protein
MAENMLGHIDLLKGDGILQLELFRELNFLFLLQRFHFKWHNPDKPKPNRFKKIKIRWQQKSEVLKSSIKTLQILSQMRFEEKIFALKARI